MDDVADRIEHTVLGPMTTWEDVTETLDTALRYGMRACIPPWAVERATEYAPTVSVTTVIGFPHGQHTTATKCQEAIDSWQAGVAEIDVVANLGLLDADSEAFDADIMEVVAAVPIPTKIIVESPLLKEPQLKRACEGAANADADYVKTATGFGGGGATVADVELMSNYLPVKASGGIGSWAFASDLFDAGAKRIGASSGDVIIEEYRKR